jgi:hypothetical protein
VTGTYGAALAVCGASLAIGQAAIALCGARRWSWLSPAVGLALLCALSWGTVRLPGHGAVSAVAVLVLLVAALLFLRGRVEGGRGALRAGLPVGVAALAAASLPFAVEGHFGILGTGFNPDMSQHLLATDRLAHGEASQLLRQGYPLGPHAIVVALNKGLGIGLVQGFGGLTVAVALLAPLTALAAFADLPPLRRTATALLAGLPYMVASYFAQGAFKETMQALFLLAFVLALRESQEKGWAGRQLRLLPAALVAVGAVYVYSFPGLLWLALTLVVWLALERSLPSRPALLALLAFAVLTVPELGRMVDFRHFETFNPAGPGLGNLFGQVSPFTALGIWPSGDFRLAPGDGAVPAAAFYLGAAFALALFIYGAIRCARRRETAVLAGIAAAATAYAAARIGGTPYTAAKALEIAAPLATLAILLPLLAGRGAGKGGRFRGTALAGLAATAYLLAAGACSLLALANAPVGPASYSPALAELRPLVNTAPTLLLASPELLTERHGRPFLAWELRGGRVCIAVAGEASRLPAGVRFVIASGSAANPPFPSLRLRRVSSPYVLWERAGPLHGRSPCPLIAVREARAGTK